MTSGTHRLRRLFGSEWWFLLALIPLVRRQPVMSFTHDLLVALLLLVLLAAAALRSRLGNRTLSGVAYVALLPVVALGLFQAGRLWGTVLLAFWIGVFIWRLVRERPAVRPAKGPLMWLVLVSITWAVVFLVIADLFLGGAASGVRPGASRLLSFLMVAGLLAAIALAGLLWWSRRDSPGSATFTAVLALSILLASEARHDARLWLGTREVKRFEEQGSYGEARAVVDELWGLSQAKGGSFVHTDLALASSRLDIRAGHPDRAVASLLWVADNAPERLPEVWSLLDAALINQLLQLPKEARDRFAIFSDFEIGSEGELLLLDRWGRVFRMTRDRQATELLYPETLPPGHAGVDLECVGEGGGLLLLDHQGKIHTRGETPPALREMLSGGPRPLAEAVDMELAPEAEGLYVVNAYGAIAAYGRTRFIPEDNPHRWNYRIIRDLEIAPEETGLVLLDGYGGLHPIGEIPFDPREPGAPYWYDVVAEDIEFWQPTGAGLYLMNRWGEWGRLGNAPLDPSGSSFPRVGGADFEIDPERREILVLHASGAVEAFPFGEQRVSDLLAEARAAKERGDLETTWKNAREVAQIAPEKTPALLSLFDGDYYEALLRAPLRGKEPFRVLRRSVRVEGKTYILDAWGQILIPEGTRFRFLADTPPLPPGQFAVDFHWIGRPGRPVILTNEGVLSYSKELPEEQQRLLEQCPRGVRRAITLAIDEETSQGYVLDEFGQIHPFGNSPIGNAAEWQRRWDVPTAVDCAITAGSGIAILDRYGGIHKVGEVKINTRVPDAPWWEDPIARAVAVSRAGDSMAVLNAFGRIVPLGEWRGEFQPGLSPEERNPYAIDMDFSEEEQAFRVLAWNGEERVVPLGDRSADRLAAEARAAFREGNCALAVEKTIQAVSAAPPRASGIVEVLDDDLLEAVAFGPYWGENAPDLVCAALPGDEPGEVFVLDRFGRVWQWKEGRYQLRRRQTVLFGREPRRAIAFRRRGDDFAVLDDAGGITVYKAEGIVRLRESVGFPFNDQRAVDFVDWKEGYLVLDNYGGITPVGLEGEDLPELPDASWQFPIARRLDRIESRIYVLDGLGGIHAPPGDPATRREGAAYFEYDLARDFEPDSEGAGFFLIDFAGRLSRTVEARPIIDPALIPPEVTALDKTIRDFEKVQRRIWKERDLGERKFVKEDYAGYDSAVDLVCDPRDDSLYLVYRTGRVAPIWSRREQAGQYAALADVRRIRGDVPGCVAELTRALVLDQDSSLLGSMGEERFPELSKTEVPGLRFFRDLEPGEANGSAFVLDRWGRVFEWSSGSAWTTVQAQALPQGAKGRGEAVAFAKVSDGGFVILTRAGELAARGPVPEQTAQLIDVWPGELEDAADLAFSANGHVAAIVGAHGQVWRVSGERAEPWPGDRMYWGEEVVRSVGLREDGTGCLAYDYFGGLHPYGDMAASPPGGSPYLNLPLMTDIWMDASGERAAFLRADGHVFFSHGFGQPPWHPRFLSPVLREFRPSIPHLWEAVSNDISSAVDVEITSDLNTLFVLRGNGDVIRVWRTEEGAREEVAAALRAFENDNAATGVTHVNRAAFLHPPIILSDAVQDIDIPAVVYDSDTASSSLAPFFVDVEYVEGAALLLDCLGGLHRIADDVLETSRGFGETARSGACAVGMAAAQEVMWIGYEDGTIERWPPKEGAEPVSLTIDWPTRVLSDVSIDSEGNHLFACTRTGDVLRLDLSAGSEEVIHSAGWDFPVAVTYLPESTRDGYLLDRYGTVHHVGKAGIFTRYAGGRHAPHWEEGWARDLCFTPDRAGLLLLDAFAGIHPLGTTAGSLSLRGLPYFAIPAAVRLLVHDNRLLVLDCRGHISLSESIPSGM